MHKKEQHESPYRYTIWLVIFTAQFSIGILIPILPIIAKKHGLDYKNIGVILAVNPALVTFLTPMVAKNLSRFSRYKIFDMGLLIEVISTAALPFTFMIENREIFFMTLISVRIIQAISYSMIFPSGMAMMTILYPQNKQKYLAFSDLMVGLGLMVGPAVGSVIIYFKNYLFGYLTLAGCYLGITLYARTKRPLHSILDDDFLSQKQQDPYDFEEFPHLEDLETASLLSDDTAPSSNTSTEFKPSFSEFLLNWRIFMGAASMALAQVSLCFLRTVLPGYLLSLNIEASTGLLLTGFAICFAIISIAIANIDNSDLDRRYLIALGLGLFALILTLTGPFYLSKDVQLPQNLPILSLGVITLGFALGLVETPLGVELVNAGNYYYPSVGNVISDYAAGTFVTATSFGGFIGFLVAGILGDVLSYRQGSTYVGIFMIAFCLLFWFTNKPQQEELSARKSKFAAFSS
mmetsp:Transcript_49079/g.56420  ORF Transcript_49079/g.56420 Transcript_49079/m.56420 type:complete len:463 (+) Transcript_49079:55-1443(+)